MKLFICAGGTGGGIYPALAAVNELQALGIPKDNMLWVGVKGEIEEQIVPRAGLRLERIIGGAMVGVPWYTALKNGLKLAWSTLLSLRLMRQFAPDVVLLTGGYMSVPVALAAKLRRVPSLAFLPDLEPGAALKFISRFVDVIAASFADSAAYFAPGKRVIGTGYPVRADLVQAAELSRTAALAQFNLTPGRPTLFVFGGSRGAQSINRALLHQLADYLATMQIIHVSGQHGWEEVADFAAQLPADLRRFYRPYPYLHEEMGAAFRAADLIVARAGASMLGEGPLFGTPAILVPYPYAWRYQKVNADYLAERGAAVRLNDDLLTEQLLPTVRQIMENPAHLAAMSHASAALRQPTAAHQLADLLVKIGHRTVPDQK